MRTILASIALVAALHALPGVAQQATREDFNELKQILAGRWVGDIVWIADWPGLGKKGDKVTGYVEYKSMEDGNAILGRFFGGNGSQTWVTVYDAAAKQIRELGVDSGGTMWSAVYVKENGKWGYIQTGSLADGKKVEGKSTLTMSDNGRTQTWTGILKVGGKEADNLHDVLRRVDK